MKYRKLIPAILAALALAVTVPAAPLRIGHVDSKLIFDGYKETKKAQTDYDAEVAKWEQQAADMQKELTDLKDRLDKQSLMLSAEKKKDLESKLQKKKTEYQQFVQKIYGKDGDLFNKNEQFSGPIIEKIKKTVQEVAAQEGYDMVLDRAAGAVVYYKADNDLTQKVLDLLNKE